MSDIRKVFYTTKTRKKRRKITEKQKKIAENKTAETEVSDEYEEVEHEEKMGSECSHSLEKEMLWHKATKIINFLGALGFLIDFVINLISSLLE